MNRRTRTYRFCLVIALALPGLASANVVTDWNAAALQAIRDTRTPPPTASRALAITHASIHDAVNGIRRWYRQCYELNGALSLKQAPFAGSVEAAASAAAHRCLSVLFPSEAADFDRLNTAILGMIPDDARKSSGIAWGQRVAQTVLKLRANDGANESVPPPPATGPGDWIPTPPAHAAYLLPQWAFLEPFAMASPSQFRPPGPPALDSKEWASDFALTQELGAVDSPTRTPEQTQIALFWADGAGTETPPGHWNHIAADIALQRGLSLPETARMFAVLNFALADAAICAWDAKYVYSWWRPVTAIRLGDTDGNDETLADSTWTPLIVTPPFPEHTSGHSTFSGAAASVLAGFFGTDSIPFETRSDALPGVTRSFPGFNAAAEEAGMSRIFGGIHFMSANLAGLAAGSWIGDWVTSHVALPRNPHN